MDTTALALALTLAASSGVDRRPFTIDDLVATPRVSSPAMSPDGKLVAFTVARPSADLAKLEASLWVVPSQGGAARRLTAAAGEKVASPRFSPDGKRLAFTSTRAGSAQAFVIPVDGGEAAQATHLPSGVNDVRWADAASLLVTSDVDPACGADVACNAAREAEATPPAAPERRFVDVDPWAVLLEQFTEVQEEEPAERKGGKRE
jgi:dipeptidyl aminopeptidase/acylaminoacyl peptidase